MEEKLKNLSRENAEMVSYGVSPVHQGALCFRQWKVKTGLSRSFGQKGGISFYIVSLTEGESLFSPAASTATIQSAAAEAAKLFNRPESRPRGAGSGISQAAGF